MWQHSFSTSNKWKNVWVAGLLQKKHPSIIRGQNRLKQLRDGPLHWETAVEDFVETFKTWLPLENFDNAEWFRQEWVGMFWKKCACKVREVRKKARQGNK
jgi:hypothetical protein